MLWLKWKLPNLREMLVSWSFGPTRVVVDPKQFFLKLWEKTTLSGDSVGWSKRPISSADYIVVHELCNYHRQDKRKRNCSQTFPSLGRLDRDRQQSSSEARHWQVTFQLQIRMCLTIPLICHGSHGYTRVNFFGRCKFLQI